MNLTPTRTEAYLDAHDEVPFPFTPCNSWALSPAQPTPQSDPFCPLFRPTDSSFASRGSSPFLSTAHAPHPPTRSDMWNGALSGEIAPSVFPPVPVPSQSTVYTVQHVSGDNVVSASNQFTHECKTNGFLDTTVSTFVDDPEHVELCKLTKERSTSCDPAAEMDDGFALPFILYEQRALSSTCLIPESGSFYPQLDQVERSFAAEGGVSSLSTVHMLPPPAHLSVWNHARPGDVDPFQSSGPSEPFTGVAQHTSRDNRQVVAVSNYSTSSNEQMHKTQDASSSMTIPALTGEQGIPINSHPEHVVLWHLMCKNAVIVDGPRKFVPQTIYEPRAQGDKERYVSLAKLHPPIIFLAHDSPQWGIPVSNLLSRQPARLAKGDEPAFASCGPSIGIRLQWPGYQPCHKQVPTRDYTHQRRMISKEKLAKVVARCIKQFMDAMSEQAMQAGSDRRWRIGPLDVRVDDIILVSLHHVSQGSWQPQLRLRRTIGTNVATGQQGHHWS